jgi:hypothetical protein
MRFGGNFSLNPWIPEKIPNSAFSSSRTARSAKFPKTAKLKKKRNPKKITSRSLVDRLHLSGSKKLPVNLKLKKRKPFFSMLTNNNNVRNRLTQKQRNFRGG